MKKITLLLVIAFSFSVGVLNAATTYYSKGSLDATLLTNWSSTTDGTGTSPLFFNTAGDVFIIQNGHSMTTSAAWPVGATSGNGKLQIQNGGKLTATFDITTKAGNTFQIDAGGTYEHKVASNLSLLFTGTESFDTNSNFIVTLCAASLIGIADNGYGNLTINNSLTGNLSFNAKVQSVKGNLTITTTNASGGYKVNITGTTANTLTIGGNLIINPADATGGVSFSTGSGTSTVNVSGNVELINGIINVGSSSGQGTFIIGGNFTQSGGTVNANANSNPIPSINFVGINCVFTKTAGNYVATNLNVSVAAEKSLTLASNFSVGAGRTLTVDGTLNIGAADTLKIGGTTAGTGVINAAVGTITYNGTSGQIISNIKDNTVNNLVVNNSTGVTLSSDITVTGNLNTMNGTITLGNYNLTVTNTGSVTNILDNIIQNGTGVFTNNSPTTVISEFVDNLRFKTLGESIEVSGLERGSKLMLYTINGQSVFNRICREDSEILTLKKGIYIAKIISNERNVELKIFVP
jgi:hypothetical protein